MAIDKDIIFMIGCPRSGTTLLNHLVRDELGLGFANELQLVPKFYQKIKQYGDLSVKKNMDRLIHDILGEPYFVIFRKAYSKRLGRPVDHTLEDIQKNLKEPSLAGVIYAVLKTTADQLGCTYVGNKHLSLGLHLDWVFEMFPNARLIHVVRDGRDCAMSLQRLWWGQRNIYTAAVLWARHVNSIHRHAVSLSDKQFLELRYEDFISDPCTEMVRLHRFVRNETPEQVQVDRYEAINKIVKKNNTFKWKEKMNQKDSAIFQAVAGKELALHGYEPYPQQRKPGFFEAFFYMAQDRLVREYNYRFNHQN